MASEADHLKKAASNKAFLQTIHEEYCDWMAIVAFYTAVHLVEALFARNERGSHDHRERNMHLKRTYPKIWSHYHPLYNASKWLRYTNQAITFEQVRQNLIDYRLASIEASVEELLKQRS